VPQLLQQLLGKMFADFKGYVSQKQAKQLLEAAGIRIMTKLRRNMKNRLMALGDRLTLCKQTIIESNIDSL
jgi:Transposase DDE domain